MKEIWAGKITVMHEISCYHCEEYQNQPSSKQAFVKHLEGLGWQKHKGKWHCKFCFEKVTKGKS